MRENSLLPLCLGLFTALGVAGCGADTQGIESPAGGEAAEETTTVDVILEACGDRKIQVIKEVRSITGVGLKEAKDLVDTAPSLIKKGASRDEAEEFKKALEAAGATVKLD